MGEVVKACILCGAMGHTSDECPWADAQQDGRVGILFVFSLLTALVSIVLAVLAIIYVHGVPMTPVQALFAVLEVFLAVSGASLASTALYKAKFWRRWLALWRYRKIDPDLCCCGSQMGQGGSICHHGGCRSAKEYAITRELGGK